MENGIEHLLTQKDAAKLFRKAPANSSFNVHIRGDAPIVDKPDSVFRNGCSGFVSISRKDAIRLVSDLIGETLEQRGARIRITEYQRFSYAREQTQNIYWIG